MIGIGLALYFKDYFNQGAIKARGNMRALTEEGERAQKSYVNSMIAQRNFSLAATYVGVNAISKMKGLAQVGFDVQDQMLAIQANMAATPAQMMKMEEGMISLSREFKMLPLEVAKANKEMLKAGATLDNQVSATRAALALAKIGETDLVGDRGSIDILTSGLSIFNKSLDESMSMVNKIARTANRTTADVKDLGESFKYGGTEAYRMNISLEEFLAFQGMLAQGGIKGSMAGTVSSNFFRYTADLLGPKPRKEAIEYAHALGLTRESMLKLLYTDPNKGGGLQGILRAFRDAMKGLDPVTKMNAMDAIFGVRGSRSAVVMNMLDKSNFGESFVSLLKEIQNSTAADTMNQVGIRNSGVNASIRDMKAAWEEMGISFSDSVAPIVVPGLKAISWALRGLAEFGKTDLGKFIFGLAAVGTVMVTIGFGLSSILTAISALRAVGAFSFLRTILGSSGTLYKGGQFLPGGGRAAAGGTTVYSGWMGRLTNSTRGLTSMFGRLMGVAGRFLAVLSGPIGWLISIGSLMMGFENTLKSIVYGIGALANALLHPWDFLKSLMGHEGYNDFNQNQGDLRRSLNFDDSEQDESRKLYNGMRTELYNPYLQTKLEGFKKQNPQMYDDKGEINVTIVNKNESLNITHTKLKAKTNDEILNELIVH